jgi:hypothetical protein
MEKSTFLKPGTLLPIAAAVLLMGVSCYYQGVWSERWGESPELKIYAEQIYNVPLEIGEWQGEEMGESEERIKRLSGSQAEFNRIYRNAAGEEVRVMLMCARFTDIFAHSPDRCYPAAGFEMLNPPEQVVIDDSEWFTTTFRKTDQVTGTHDERGYWSWTADGKWYAPDNERARFTGERALYKMYVFSVVPSDGKSRTDKDICGDFIRDLVPAVTTALRPGFERVARIRAGEDVADVTAPAAAETKAAEPEKAEAEPAA